MSTAKKQWDDTTPEMFIERVKTLMAERGWTRKVLAERLGIGVTGLILDKNKAFPSIKVMQKYADVFGVEVWDMIYDCGAPAVGVRGKAATLKWQTQEELNAHIAEILNSKGVSQAQLSAKLGISTSLMSANLSSKNMSLLILMRVASGLGVEPWELLIDREDMEREVARRRNGGRMPEEVGAAEVVQPVQQKGASVKENVQQMQIDFGADALPWDEEVMQKREAEAQQREVQVRAREADKRLSAIPLRVIRIIRCPYCQHEIEIND